MRWIGKLALGALGLAIRGPVGAIGGALVGAIIDSAPDQWRRIFTGTVAEDDFVAACALLGKVAAADGPVNQEELRAFVAFMEKQGLRGKAMGDASAIFNIAGESPFSFEQLAVSFFRLVNYEDSRLHAMVKELLDMAACDGPVNPAEDRLAQEAAEIFLMGRAEYASIRGNYKTASNGGYGGSTGRSPRSSLAYRYETLGVSPSDSDEAIKKRYQKLVADFHPDKIAAHGLPEEFTRFANSKLAEINEAYDAIRKHRGIN
jgi:DnaJ like chaperone protein